MGSDGTHARTAAPAVWTIPAGRPFALCLVRELLARRAPSTDLSDITIYVPTRRAASTIGDLFVSECGPRTLLLPDIRPLGDVGEEEQPLGFEDGEGRPAAGDIPPAMAPVRRRLLLARLVHAMRKSHAGGLAEAARLAGDLMRLLDTLHHEGLDLEALDGIAGEEVADHWRETLKFLGVLRDHWPAILEEEGVAEPAWRQRELLLRQASSWAGSPPSGPVIVAGSTGTVRAVRELMRTVAALPQGEIVFPGLDRELDSESFEDLDETHPQSGLVRVLDDLGITRADVRDWPGSEPGGGVRARAKLLAEAMRPAGSAGRWPESAPGIAPAALDGLAIVEAADTVEEAGVVALLMRETLETPGRTCALVTRDRELARRVRTTLRRWRIEVEDSAGELLAQTPRGSLVRLAARAGAEGAGPVPLLALLKHPLAAGGMERAAFRRNVRGLERRALRGLPPWAGPKEVRNALRRARQRALRRGNAQAADRVEDLLAWFDGLEERMRPLLGILGKRKAAAAAAAEALRAFVEWLAGTDAEAGADVLRADIDGRGLFRFFKEFAGAAPGLGVIRGADFPGLLDASLEGEAVFPPHPSHPRLSILSPIEARMLGADRIIAGGLVEGTWPLRARPDPWLGRRMRRDLGLPSLERRVGLAAHDFVDAASTPEVFLTYARKTRGTPTVPARWITRLRTVLEAAGAEKPAPVPALAWWREIVRPPPYDPVGRPVCVPPVAARPRRLSVTGFRRLVREPYAAYGAYVLGLRPLDRIAPEPGPAEFGSAVHEAVEGFVKELEKLGGDALPPDALERLLARGDRVFRRFRAAPATHAFWIRRFGLIARWFLGQEAEARRAVRRTWAECQGERKFDFPGGKFRLIARADRIEERTDGSLAILDYKTGTLPSFKAVDEGDDPQLPLSALIAEAGGFKGVPAAPVSDLAYWRLTGREAGGESRAAGSGDARDLVTAADVLLRETVEGYDDPDTPYQAVEEPEPYSDYVDLARVREWAVAGVRDEDGE